jgi:hypothetical protein
MFSTNEGIFIFILESRFTWFSNCDFIDDHTIKEYKLIGNIILIQGQLLGLAIYNGVILDINFPLCLFKKLLNIPVSLTDLADLDPV